MRQLDYSKISVETITDALVARELIERNTGQQLLDYITTESIRECDTFKFVDNLIPVDLLDPANLIIPKNMNHYGPGVDYILNLLKEEKVPVHVLMSIQALQWLSIHL